MELTGICIWDFGGETQQERDHQEDLDICGRITLKWIFKIQDGIFWTGWVWLWIGTSGGFL
jgi:hypothetical protein